MAQPFVAIPSQPDMAPHFASETAARNYLINHGVLREPGSANYPCPTCGNERMTLKTGSESQYRCCRKSCRKTVSIYNGTIFEHRRVPINRLLHLAHLYAAKQTLGQMALLTGLDPYTVAAWARKFAHALQLNIQNLGEEGKIGGPDIVSCINPKAKAFHLPPASS